MSNDFGLIPNGGGMRLIAISNTIVPSSRRCASWRLELIKAIHLPAEFNEELDPFVRDKYLEFWRGIQESPVGPVEPWPDEVR
jgi:hypothetical protein